MVSSLKGAPGPIIAASDFMKALPDLLGGHLDRKIHSLGTDGFGRSDTRGGLRSFFEVDRRHIVHAALYELMREGKLDAELVTDAMKRMGIDARKLNPMMR